MTSPGEIIKRAREAARMTQAELAIRAGTRQGAISAYETGRRDPGLATLERLVNATGHKLSVELLVKEKTTTSLPNTPLGRLIDEHREELKRIMASHGGERAFVFGSVARGEDDEGSDLDLLVELPARSGILTLGKIARDVERVLGVEVDVVPVSTLNSNSRERVMSEAVQL